VRSFLQETKFTGLMFIHNIIPGQMNLYISRWNWPSFGGICWSTKVGI